jgi:hypothetical protein
LHAGQERPPLAACFRGKRAIIKRVLWLSTGAGIHEIFIDRHGSMPATRPCFPRGGGRRARPSLHVETVAGVRAVIPRATRDGRVAITRATRDGRVAARPLRAVPPGCCIASRVFYRFHRGLTLPQRLGRGEPPTGAIDLLPVIQWPGATACEDNDRHAAANPFVRRGLQVTSGW